MIQTKSIIATIKRTMRSVANVSNSKRIFTDRLPLKIKMFIYENMNGKSIAFAEKNAESKAGRYIITMNDNTLLSFDHKGEWTKVVNTAVGVPTGIIPPAIFRFAYFCFPESIIVAITKQSTGYLTTLSNDVSLKFNQQGQIYGFAN